MMKTMLHYEDRTRFTRSEEVRNVLTPIIERARQRTRSIRKSEIDSGKKLFNSPKSRLLQWPTTCSENIEISVQDEVLPIWNQQNELNQTVLKKDSTTYFDAYDEWASFPEVMECLLHDFNMTYKDACELLPEVYHFVYGVLNLVRLHITGAEPRILMGIRATNLAGMNAGKMSFPGGLVDKGETVALAAKRELEEEGKYGYVLPRKGFAFGMHNAAPSITFMSIGDTVDPHIYPCNEWNGSRMVWIPEHVVKEALARPDHNAYLAQELRAQGFQHPFASLSVAPDAIEPARTLLRAYPK